MELGHKIIVLGCPGSGKSTLSVKLHEITGLPLIHLDNFWWRPDRSHVSGEEFDGKLEEVLSGGGWIIDGDYSRTYEARFKACDTVVFLDYGTDECLEGITARVGKQRADLPWTETGIDPELVDAVRNYRNINRPAILTLLERHPDRNRFVFGSRREADEWIGGLDGMELILPAGQYARQIRAYRKEFLDCGDSMDGTGGLKRIGDPVEWIAHCELCRDPENVPEGLVPATQFIYVRKDDGKIVGMLQIRHCLNDYLGKFGGHIGYSVAPSERRKGYASQMLRKALPKCRELGIGRVLITCREDNEGSQKVILTNGGTYDGTVFEPEEKINLERYWIDLPG